MTLPVIFHELAENELNEAAAYYAKARPGLGDAFIAEVQYAVDALATTPLAGRAVEATFAGGAYDGFPTASFTEYATAIFVFLQLAIINDGRSIGRGAMKEPAVQ